ncbi:MAG: hypothetical protein KDI92_08950 [Xanthomonadales bacterium]|nr:hypothetical protein [Xanthomonadales bacterium]
MKTIILMMGWLLTGLLHSPLNLAQDIEDNKPTSLEFAHHLRSHYDITQAAYLTQMAWQLSHSFASAEQLEQQWQQALDTPIAPFSQYSRINTHALMAQTLILHSNGMSLNRWRTVDLEAEPRLPALKEGLTADQAFQVWVNLSFFWQQILKHSPQENFVWFELSNTPKKIKIEAEEPLTSHAVVLPLLANEANTLEQVLANADTQTSQFSDLAIALVRQQKHFQSDQWLALANDWIEIYQLLELSPFLLTVSEQQHLQTLIDRTQQVWEAQEAAITEIDLRIHPIIKLLLTELPQKFKNPDHLNASLNEQFFMLALDIKNIHSYFNHPIRKTVQENLEVCLNLSASQAPDPRVPIATNQFESCFKDFMDWATVVATDSTFTGNQIRLDNPASLHRALELPSFQIINILSMQATTEESCQQQLASQVNVLEWLMATESLVWFHDRWPGIFAEYDKSAEFVRLIDMGNHLHNYPPCFNQSLILKEQFLNLKSKWEKLKQAINNQISNYAKEHLHQNTDVNLFGSMDQKTNYIPQDMVIAACDVTTSCGAFIQLKPNLDLLNLFPNHVKLASQFGLGDLSICYDNAQWQNRKIVPTHLDNNKIANFEGQLSIELNGLFGGRKVFTQQLTSEQRHVYLFGENNQETLDMSCPLSIVGKQINTTLDRGTFGLLPNRLTFLTAQKADINKVIKSNWESWQSAIKTDSQEHLYYDEMKELKIQLNDAFLQHVNRLQQQIYRKLITNNPSRINDSALSKATFDYLNQRKLLRYITAGLFPSSYHNQTPIRSAITGSKQLMDAQFFKNAFEHQINIIDMMTEGDALFSTHESAWTGNDVNETPNGFVNATLNELQSALLTPQ